MRSATIIGDVTAFLQITYRHVAVSRGDTGGVLITIETIGYGYIEK
ncbi:MAG: hypothetical protein ACE5F8_08350 [Woeseiaceae bacterium]